MATVVLTGLSPAQDEGWQTLLDLAEAFPAGWCLVGGQLVWLLAAEHGAVPPRATDDVDVVVDVRAEPAGVRTVCSWLESRGLELEGINAHGIGHRYVRPADPGPGMVIFDVLAPDNVGPRAKLTTSPPARTVAAPGGRLALNSAEAVRVSIGGRAGTVMRPSLLAAILVKAAATTLATRTNRDRDWTDAAFLLSLVPDPIAMTAELVRADRTRLRRLTPLLDSGHAAWRPLGDERARLGHATLEFLVGE